MKYKFSKGGINAQSPNWLEGKTWQLQWPPSFSGSRLETGEREKPWLYSLTQLPLPAHSTSTRIGGQFRHSEDPGFSTSMAGLSQGIPPG